MPGYQRGCQPHFLTCSQRIFFALFHFSRQILRYFPFLSQVRGKGHLCRPLEDTKTAAGHSTLAPLTLGCQPSAAWGGGGRGHSTGHG